MTVASSSPSPSIPLSMSEQLSAMLPSRNVIIASSISGLLSRMILHPIDTVKARLQVQQTQHTHVGGAATTTTLSTHYKHSMDAIRKIHQNEGIRGFYKGLGASLFFTAPAVTLYLTFYDIFNSRISAALSDENTHARGNHEIGWRSAVSHLASGFLAETFSCVVWVPHDVLKERLQVSHQDLRFKELLKIIRSDGIRALYRGYGVTLATFGPQSAIYFMSYEYMKRLTKAEGEDNNTSMSFLLSASVASTISSAIVCPLDVVKTRMQVQRRADTSTGGGAVYYEGMIHGLRTMVKQEGLRSLFKGLMPRIAYSAPNAAIIMTLYEWIKRALDKGEQE